MLPAVRGTRNQKRYVAKYPRHLGPNRFMLLAVTGTYDQIGSCYGKSAALGSERAREFARHLGSERLILQTTGDAKGR